MAEADTAAESPKASKKGQQAPPPPPGLKGKVKAVLDDVRSEFVVTGIVIVYMLMVLFDLVFSEPADCGATNVTVLDLVNGTWTNVTMLDDNSSEGSFEQVWGFYFNYIDMGFLCLFMTEILVRLWVYGPIYFTDIINGIDAAIIVAGTIMQVLVLTESGVVTNLSFLRIVRLVRLVRLFVVMNKVQKARSAYKRTKYLKLGSPVDRVMDLLKDITARCEEDEDVNDVTWIMQLIASDKLYQIDMKSIAGGQSAEMAAFLNATMGGGDEEPKKEEPGQEEEEKKEMGMLKRQETQNISAEATAEMTRIDEIVENPEMAAHLQNVHEWNIDIFDYEAKAQGAALSVTLQHYLQGYGLLDKFRISKHRLLSFTRKIQEGYRSENPYHNATHALDVLLNTNYFLRQPVISALITPLDRLAALVAATIHDFQHPGLNNVFLQATKHDYAITYNDQSVLESHHVAASWKVLLQEENNFLKGMTREQYLEMRDTVIQLVLGTDMKYHFEHYTKFKTKCGSGTFKPGCERDDIKFLLAVAMHTGDIANPAKPMRVCLTWTEQVMEEFFRQGDLEAQLGMPISPFYDRSKANTAQCQIGFINVLVRPLYAEVCNLLGEPALSECFGALEANLHGWEAHGNELMKMHKENNLPVTPDEAKKKPSRTSAAAS